MVKDICFIERFGVEEFKKEILESINVISSKLGVDCSTFVYPYGSHNKYMVSIIKEAGIRIQEYDSRNK
jgi:peptidoglycan/xylan/chitin deacetylase (PgdA/CDA1 family)